VTALCQQELQPEVLHGQTFLGESVHFMAFGPFPVKILPNAIKMPSKGSILQNLTFRALLKY